MVSAKMLSLLLLVATTRLASALMLHADVDGNCSQSDPVLFPDPEAMVKTIGLSSNDQPHEQRDEVKVWRFNVSETGCRSARLHIKPFHMLPGDQITVYGLQENDKIGLQSFTGKGLRHQGEVYTHRVWAPELLLELHVAHTDSHFVIDYIHYGDCYSPSLPPPPESTCGNDDKQNIKCIQWSAPVVFTQGPSVLKLSFVRGGRGYVCTTWKLANDRFMTNYHCLNNQAEVNTAELFYKYDSTSCPNNQGGSQATYHGNNLIQTSGSNALDFTIYTLNEATPHIPCLKITGNHPAGQSQMYIIQHPGGRRKMVGIRSDQDAGNVCRVSGTCRTNDFCYMCDTEGGSSGSPVFDWSTNKVFALHHYGGCPNSGVQMSRIINAAGANLGSCSCTG